MSGAQVRAGVRSVVVRVEVEEAVVGVGVIVAADIDRVRAGVRVDAETKESRAPVRR